MFALMNPTAARTIARQKSEELRTSARRATLARRAAARHSH